MDLPWRNRRQQLEAVAARFGIPVSRYKAIQNDAEIRVLFQTAKQQGHEGLMLKSVESAYEAGQRRKTWMKVKEPEEALTTVILYAHAGSGKRGGTYSDFTLGVRTHNAPDSPFVPIGKAYGGYSNEELKQLNNALRDLVLDRFGPTIMLKPTIVVELEFDEIQQNSRTKAGFSLRFPRFKRIRWDLGPADTDTIEVVKQRWELRISGRANTPETARLPGI
jgi:DNA ligase-1